MHKTIISDASVLIVLHKINEIEILKKVYNEVVITPLIASEFGEEIPDWIKIKSVENLKYQAILETMLDKGEASALSLAFEMGNSLLILDDLKARKVAHDLNLKFTGTLGVINKAKYLGVIPHVKPIIEKLIQTNFRISTKIVNEMLRQNNE
jgi:predicted nucleic acid-binding protein